MSRAKAVKVVRNRDNLRAVIKQTIENLGNTLEYAPPHRSGRYDIEVRICIKEIGEKGTEVGMFHYFEAATKEVAAPAKKVHP
ncbi:MAG: hypothetical protein V4436_02615 [Patescibacteria group bacterium]